ncbi:MAG TPA: hypothetical protein VHO72_14035 [Bacteroidales bacterium]|nr:hypothetical protein [Bacteroidales bacterium]
MNTKNKFFSQAQIIGKKKWNKPLLIMLKIHDTKEGEQGGDDDMFMGS